MFRSVACREPLKLEATRPNIRYAVRLRGEVLNAIERGTFNYFEYFPDSKNARRFGFVPSAEMVGEKLRAWMAIARLAPSTRLTYERVCNRYLYPWFDGVRLRDLTAPTIRAKVLALRKADAQGEGDPVTLKTARNILTPLGSMLELAVGDREIDVSPMAALKLERFWPAEHVTSDFEADPFTWAEMLAIFAACDGGTVGEEADYWRFAFGTGLRPSEQIELFWPCCDLVQQRVAVEIARVTAKGEGRLKIGCAVKVPKTKAGRRLVDLTTGAWEALQRQQSRTRLQGAHVWRDTRYAAPVRSEEALRKRFSTLLKRAGVRYRNPYQTRHTFASNLLAAGHDPKWVAGQMGHETTEMLERHYGKWILQGREDRQPLAAFFSHVSPTLTKPSAFLVVNR